MHMRLFSFRINRCLTAFFFYFPYPVYRVLGVRLLPLLDQLPKRDVRHEEPLVRQPAVGDWVGLLGPEPPDDRTALAYVWPLHGAVETGSTISSCEMGRHNLIVGLARFPTYLVQRSVVANMGTIIP